MLSEKRKFIAISKEFEHVGYPPSLCHYQNEKSHTVDAVWLLCDVWLI